MSSSSNSRATQREGIALPIALAAIVVVGALIAGVFFASTQEYRVGRNTLAAQRALHGAEVGLSQVVSSWTSARTTSTRVGQTVKLVDTVIDEAWVQRQYTKVSPTVFWVTSTSVAGSLSLQGRSLKRLNTLIRVANPDFKIMGAATLRGVDAIGGSAKVSGTDTTMANWDCPAGGAPGAGLVVSDSSGGNPQILGGGGCALYSCISGDPQIKDSTEIVKDTMTFTKFGGFTYETLASGANVQWTAADGTSISQAKPYFVLLTGACDMANKLNWGAISQTNPPGKCDDYYPVIHLNDPAVTYTITGQGGQGIILADGNLEIAGNFTWTGLILVRGSLRLQGTGGMGTGVKIIGAIAAMNRGGATNTITGNSNITFSRCALNQVTARLATALPTKYRAWADMSF
ncbi:MAG: hypothetical protein M3282_08550 [Gemmatimonadota bacterium]|nr:hypothetical protein [Gemmatimonadota bacterium]